MSVESSTADGNEAALAHEARREAFDLGRGGRRAVERDQRHAELLGERGQHVAHGDEAHVDQDLAQLVAALALQFERALQILRLIWRRSISISPRRMRAGSRDSAGDGSGLRLRTAT